MPKRNAKGVTSGVGLPHRMTGRDGDITIRRTKDGKIVYIKEHGAWHPINTGIDVAQLKKDVDRLSRLFDNSNKNSNATITTNLINVRKNTSTATVDPKIKFTVGGTEEFVLGLDTNDSNKFKIDTGGTIGGATKVTLDGSGNLTTAGLVTATRLNVSSGETEIDGDSTTPTGAGDFGYHVDAGGFAAHGVGLVVDSYTTTAGSNQDSAIITLSKGTGDAFYRCNVGATPKWAFGNDNTDAGGATHKFKIHNGTALVDSSLFTLDTSGNLTTTGTISSSAGELGIGDITGVRLTADDTNNVTDSSGSADFTIAGGTKCATAGSGSTITVNVDDAFIINNGADVMSVSDFGATAALEIRAEQPSTPLAENSSGLYIDYDRIVAGSGTAAHNDIGINLDVNSDSRGTSSAIGMDIDVVAGTTGTCTGTGLDINVSGSDNNHGLDITVPDGANDYHIKLIAADDAFDYATFTLADTGDLTIETVGNGTTDSSLTLNIDGGLYIDVDSGEARILDGGGVYTPSHSTSIITKAYVDSVKYTAVWGGNLARVGSSGRWYGIPTGHLATNLDFGSGASPVAALTLLYTADDLVACIWASMHDITVTGCRMFYGQGGANNSAHGLCLMKYDMDADGDLSNGVVVASATDSNSDDYSQVRATSLTLSGTAANLDVDFSAGQILIAFIEPEDAYNANMGAKVILEYTEVAT